MYEFSGVPTYDIREGGLYARSYVLYQGVYSSVAERGEWRLIRPFDPDESFRLIKVFEGMTPEDQRRFCTALARDYSPEVAEKLSRTQTTGEWFAVLAAEGVTP